MLSDKQGEIKYHFLSLWYDSTRDWTPVSQTIGETLLIRRMARLLLLPRDFVYFWTNTLEKGMNSLTLPAMG